MAHAAIGHQHIPRMATHRKPHTTAETTNPTPASETSLMYISQDGRQTRLFMTGIQRAPGKCSLQAIQVLALDQSPLLLPRALTV